MPARATVALMLGVASGTLGGCAPAPSGCEPGSAGCECTASGCLPGLECRSNICAHPLARDRGDAGGAAASASAGAEHGEAAGSAGRVGSPAAASVAAASPPWIDPASEAGEQRRFPSVKQAVAEVGGSLDKDVIRRIVRAQSGDVRECYQQGLARTAGTKGRVVIRFTIEPTGTVGAADVVSSDLTDRDVAPCIANAVRRWSFPNPPAGDAVRVTYPFLLTPG